MASKADSNAPLGHFDEVLLDSVDYVVKMVLGEFAAGTIYQYLEKRRELKRDEIPSRVADFSIGLNQLLGQSSAHMLEKLMIKQLCSKLEMEYDLPSDFNFEIYVHGLKDRFRR